MALLFPQTIVSKEDQLLVMANRTISLPMDDVLVSSHAPINHFKVVKSAVPVFGHTYDLFLRRLVSSLHAMINLVIEHPRREIELWHPTIR